MPKRIGSISVWLGFLMFLCSCVPATGQSTTGLHAAQPEPTVTEAPTLTPEPTATVRPCEGTLDEVAHFWFSCPSSFDGSAASLPTCLPGAKAEKQIVYLCGDTIELVLTDGYMGVGCFYDSSTHQLVGAEELADAPLNCAGRRWAGRISASGCQWRETASRGCRKG